jgi:hypothetical protein
MGAKNSLLVYAQGDAREALKNARTLDRDASCKLVQSLFPGAKPRDGEKASLQWTYPPSGQVYVGCYPGVAIVANGKFARDYPSKIPAAWLAPGSQGTTYLHAMHSVVDWCAFGVWEKGVLRRSFSATPESGEPDRMILENLGEKLPFELPYWAGEHPLYEDGEDAQDWPLKFDPMELGEAALFEFFGYQLEGEASELFDPAQVELMTFEIKPWWKFW